MYSFKSRVRFSETDTDKKLSVASLMNYLQDCSIFQSEDIGAGFSYMEKSRRACYTEKNTLKGDFYEPPFEKTDGKRRSDLPFLR